MPHMDETPSVWDLRRQVVRLLKKEADALNLAAELIRTGNASQPWLLEVLRSAELCRTECAPLLEKLREIDSLLFFST